MTNVLSFGNIAKQYSIQYLQELDTFQAQLCDHVYIFGHEQGDNLYVLGGHQPERTLNRHPHPKRMSPPYRQHHMSKLLKRMPSFSLPRRWPEPMWLSNC